MYHFFFVLFINIIFLTNILLACSAYAVKFIGSEKCSQCHEKQFEEWKDSLHAKSTIHLSEHQKNDARCQLCHNPSSLTEKNLSASVHCETCHGPGEFYAFSYVMKDRELSRLLGLKSNTIQNCSTCHNQDSPSTEPFRLAGFHSTKTSKHGKDTIIKMQ